MKKESVIGLLGACCIALSPLTANAADKLPTVKAHSSVATVKVRPRAVQRMTKHTRLPGRASAASKHLRARITPRGLGSAGEAARAAQAARGAKQVRDAADAMRGLQGGHAVDPMHMGLGANNTGPCIAGHCAPGPQNAGGHHHSSPTGLPMPDLPSNRDKRGGGLAPDPEGDLHEMVGNIAGQDASGRSRPRRTRGESHESHSNSSGFSYRRDGITYDDGGEMTTERSNPDGSSAYVHTEYDSTSRTYNHVVVEKNPDGSTEKRTQSGNYGPDGVPEEVGDDHGSAVGHRQPGENAPGEVPNEEDVPGEHGGLAETQTIETASRHGGYVPPNYQPRPSVSHNPTKVDPGPDGATPKPDGAHLVINRERLVTNPEAVHEAPHGGFVPRLPDGPNQVDPPRPGTGQ
ncbi:MAG: hypothetical protein P8009_08240 [Gammaproteobacteria bacterium]